MPSVDRDSINEIAKTTTLLVDPAHGALPFGGEIALVADTWPAYVDDSGPSWRQNIDAAYGRGINAGRGVVGEGGNTGTGVVGIAGGALAKRDKKQFPRPLTDGPQPGRNARIGVLGIGRSLGRGETEGIGDAIGVLGVSDSNAGVYGQSNNVGVIGDAREGRTGVHGISGNQYGVFGQVNPGHPNDDMIGVFGLAGFDDKLKTTIGSAGVFAGRVYVSMDLRVDGNFIIGGTKSAAARHADGTRRLMYCMESPESQFEDFGEAKLVNGRADVRLDRDFIGVADTRNYHVFVTAYGDSQGLYVAARHRNGFQVREQGGGRSRLTFSYRVVAKRKDVKTKRFAKVGMPKITMPGAPMEPPGLGGRLRRASRRGKALRRTPARRHG